MARQGRSPDVRLGIFKDGETDWVLNRTLAFASEKCAELGDVLYTARRIDESNPESWINEWANLAESVEEMGDIALTKGHRVSARECFLRASNYYRTAEYGAPPTHHRFYELWQRSRTNFHKAGDLFSPAIQRIVVDFEGWQLPGYFWRPDQSSSSHPTLIAAGGNDSSLEEVMFWTGMAAVRRGYNFFTFEHPGHRGALHLYPECVKRPDYETPYRHALDHLTSLPGVDDRIAMTGYSLGGYVACRVAAHEKRIRAVAPNPPIVDVYRLFSHDSQDALILKVLPTPWLNRMIDKKMRDSPLRYALAKYTMWSFGVPDLPWMEFSKFAAQKPFKVGAGLRNISIPALALAGAGEGEEMLRQTREFYTTISSQNKRMHIFTINEDRANGHCQLDNRSRANQVMYDWLDETFDYHAIPLDEIN